VLARNWRCRTADVDGEVDIVAAAPGVVVFCEVKSRASAGFGGPAAAVDHRKQARLRRLAVAWLATHRPGVVQVRFDVAAVVGDELTMIEAAF
jgi:putative endonuclease